jgi:predicted ATPase/DNA-binding XRE family transcriptional regulator
VIQEIEIATFPRQAAHPVVMPMNKSLSDDLSFGEWLRQRRHILDLTQQELADQVGCARITLRRIEAGALKPSKELALILLEKLAAPQAEIEAWLRFARGLSGFPEGSTDSFTSQPNTNLPASLTSFIGREKEQYEIEKLVKQHRLVTLVGVGGIGKTRLSIQIAASLLNDYPDGLWSVDLAPLSDPTIMPQTIVNTLGLIEQAGHSPLRILTDFLQEKRVLLVLDNCEHLIEACAPLVEALLHSCADLRILTTSREALSIAGETLYLVPPLITPAPIDATAETLIDYEAVQLFVERAQACLSNFSIKVENAAAIAQICHDLDGIPLALELAAARVKELSVEQIASRLNDRFRLLTGGSRTALPRHQTLQALIDWSHNLLSEPERVLFRRLSVFAGRWTLEAAESVCSDENIKSQDVLDLLAQLINKSLVNTEERQNQTRYHMLETVRQYTHEKLREAGEEEILRKHHLAYYVDLAKRAEPNLRAFDMVVWLDRLEAELDNIRTALDWAAKSDIEAQLRLASALLWFWHIRSYRNEGIDWLEQGLSIEAMERGEKLLWPERALIRGKALNASGILLSMYSEFEKAREQLEESLTLFQELGLEGKQGMAYALWTLAELLHSGNRVQSLLEQSLLLFREVGDKFGIAECLMGLAVNATYVDDFNQAAILGEEHLALRREIGDQDGIAIALIVLGNLAFRQEDYQRAITLFEEGLAIFRKVGNKGGISRSLVFFGDVFLWQGDYERASKIYEETLAFAQQVGDRSAIARYYFRMGFIVWFQGNYVRATQMIEDGLPVFRELGQHWYVAVSLHTLGGIALAQADYERAAEWYEAELTFSQQKQIEMSLIFALYGLGKVAWVQGDYDLAAKRFEEGLRMRREAGFKYATFHAFYGLGRVAQSQGDYVTARAYYTEALGIQQWKIGASSYQWVLLKTYKSAVAYPLSALAVLATLQNQMERATKLLAGAEMLYAPLRFEMSAKERAEYDHAMATTRAALGEEAFIAAYEEGKKMRLEESISYGLEVV